MMNGKDAFYISEYTRIVTISLNKELIENTKSNLFKLTEKG